LGPILLIIFINAVCDIIVGTLRVSYFADDIKLYASVDFNDILRPSCLFIRCINVWNYLPEETRSYTSVAALKSPLTYNLTAFVSVLKSRGY